MAWRSIQQGELEEAWRIYQEGLRRSQGTVDYLYLLEGAGALAETEGDLEKASDYYEKIDPPAFAQMKEMRLARVLWKQGRHPEAEKKLSLLVRAAREKLSGGAESPGPQLILAKAYAIRGEKEEAYKQLEGAVELGWKHYYEAQIDPAWENLREEPLFQQLMAKLKADVDEMALRVERMEKELEP
jgi:tetratricopeptide (TPR) repeat protein